MGGRSSPPKPPDPEKTAAAQAATNGRGDRDRHERLVTRRHRSRRSDEVQVGVHRRRVGRRADVVPAPTKVGTRVGGRRPLEPSDRFDR